MPGPLPAVPKTVRVDHHFGEGADPNMQIRLFLQYAGTLNAADAATWAHAIAVAMGTFVTNNMAPTIGLLSTELTDLTSTSSPQVTDSTTAVGGIGTQAVPAGVALVMRKHIARRYRGGHPRVYLPGISNLALSTPSLWDPTFLGNVTTHFAAYITAATTAPGGTAIGAIQHVNVSFFSGFTNHTYPSGRVKPIPNPRVTPLVDAVLNITANPIPASQRRRNEQP